MNNYQITAYSENELQAIYALGRFLLEKGDLSKAELLFRGLTVVSPEFYTAWLALSHVQNLAGNLEEAVISVKQALVIEGESIIALLFLITYLISIGDYQSAGTYLGEVSEKLEGGQSDNPNIIRYFKIQLARFQERGAA